MTACTDADSLAETVRCCGGEPQPTNVTDIHAAASPEASGRRPMISPRIGDDSYRIRQTSWASWSTLSPTADAPVVTLLKWTCSVVTLGLRILARCN
jgi:hypothetical protein